jgi:hypothetical protein
LTGCGGGVRPGFHESMNSGAAAANTAGVRALSSRKFRDGWTHGRFGKGAIRAVTGLTLLRLGNALKGAFLPYTLEAPFGALLDATKNRLALTDVQCAEIETLIGVLRSGWTAGLVLDEAYSFWTTRCSPRAFALA